MNDTEKAFEKVLTEAIKLKVAGFWGPKFRDLDYALHNFQEVIK